MLSSLRMPSVRQRLYHIGWEALDWVFPPVCVGCKTEGERLCPACRDSLVSLKPPLCRICSKPLRLSANMDPSAVNICPDCAEKPPSFEALRSCVRYTGVGREAALSLKFRRNLGLAEVLADIMFRAFVSTHWNIDVVTCVPLSHQRLRQREYNQSAHIAYPLALRMAKPFQPLLLRKTLEIPSQVGLSADARRENVRDAFSLGVSKMNGEAVLLIDDIATTGATLNACAQALLDGGADRVFCLTFARAGISEHNQPVLPESDL